jgi:hypothetical protein
MSDYAGQCKRAADAQGVTAVQEAVLARGIPCQVWQTGGFTMACAVPLISDGSTATHWLQFGVEGLGGGLAVICPSDKEGEDDQLFAGWGSDDLTTLADKVEGLWTWFHRWRGSFGPLDGADRENAIDNIGDLADDIDVVYGSSVDGAVFALTDHDTYVTAVGNHPGIETADEDAIIGYLWRERSRYEALSDLGFCRDDLMRP